MTEIQQNFIQVSFHSSSALVIFHLSKLTLKNQILFNISYKYTTIYGRFIFAYLLMLGLNLIEKEGQEKNLFFVARANYLLFLHICTNVIFDLTEKYTFMARP